MRIIQRATVGAVLLSAFASAIVWLHYQSLETAADSIRRPVSAVVTDVYLREVGRGGIAASVSFTDEDGNRVVAELPDLGHDRSSYDTPFVIVYDATEPSRAMLASDWQYAQTARPELSKLIALAVLILDTVIVVVFVFVRRTLALPLPRALKRAAR